MSAEKTRMQELIEILDKAGAAYYSGNDEIMSNYEYDALYDELVALEEKTGIVLAGSPTVSVGYEVLSETILLLLMKAMKYKRISIFVC